ncbi:hypothetical protein C1646_774814 [Rhizophagus diaphanus]|nr:hypothetical protein C1646_774814 [Rhizophagus diaphanus] [Rhizophagus sp. MUCL 43196]
MVQSKSIKKSKSMASRTKAAGIAQSQLKAAKTDQGQAKTVLGTDEEGNDEFNDEDGGINNEISNEDNEIDFLGNLSKDQQNPHCGHQEQEEKYRLIDEEIKCLFLRAQFPPGLVFEKLVQKIFPEFETYSSTAKSIIDRCRKSFSDYRGTTTETQVEITNFILREVAIKRILNYYFSAVDISEISEILMDKLIEFLREYFSIAWKERNETNTKAFYDQIKRLDKNTENLEILSYSGKNFASSLKF